MQWIFVFLGGGLGSVCRYLISRVLPQHMLPMGTLVANVVSSFIIGALVMVAAEHMSTRWRSFFIVGFCGGFSTFSTFSLENARYLQDGRWTLFVAYSTMSVLICMLSVLCGMYAARQLGIG